MVQMKHVTKYRPTIIKARPWDELEKYFSNVEYCKENIAELIRHIRLSGLDKRLFAYSSVYKLVVSIYESIEFNRETLHITFDLSSQMWHFAYYALPFDKPEFERQYPLEQGIEKFDNFIEMIRW